MKKRPLLSGILMVLLAMCHVAAAAASSEDIVNITRLVQEAPPLETYGAVPGAVWQRHESYSLRPDGAMEKDSLWIVMTTGKLERTWPERLLSVPSPGELEILQADLYDPVSGGKIRSIPYVTQDEGGYRRCAMDMGESDEAVLVLRFRQVYLRKMSVEGLITPSSDLPLWEGVFSVSIPSGSELFVQSNKMDQPKIDKAGGKSTYSWTVYNIPGIKRKSMFLMGEPYLAFALRSGRIPFVQLLSQLDKSSLPPMPDEFDRIRRMGDKTKAGKQLMKAMDGRALPNSSGILRDEVPSKGPWTELERTMVLNSWLRDMGWRSRVVWLTYLPIGSSEPAFTDNLLVPVLRVAPPGSDYWFFVPDQTVEPGETPPMLVGKTLYGGSSEEGLLSFSLEKGKAEDHRLTLAWNLELNDQGFLIGALQLWVRNGWVGMFPNPRTLSWSELEAILPGVSSWKNGDPEFSPMDYGYRVDLPVKKAMGIPGGPGMLLRLPCLIPGALNDLASSSPTQDLLFPFVVEQKYSVKIPDGFNPMSIPATSDRKEGNLRFSETLRFSKKQGSLEGEEKIVALSSKFDEQFAYGLNRVMGAWSRWEGMSIPLAAKK